MSSFVVESLTRDTSVLCLKFAVQLPGGRPWHGVSANFLKSFPRPDQGGGLGAGRVARLRRAIPLTPTLSHKGRGGEKYVPANEVSTPGFLPDQHPHTLFTRGRYFVCELQTQDTSEGCQQSLTIWLCLHPRG